MLRHFRLTSCLRTTTKHSFFYVLMVAIWNRISTPCARVHNVNMHSTAAHQITTQKLGATNGAAERRRDTLGIDFVHFKKHFCAIIGRIYVPMFNRENFHNRRTRRNGNWKEVKIKKGKKKRITSETQTHLWTRNCLTRVFTDMDDSAFFALALSIYLSLSRDFFISNISSLRCLHTPHTCANGSWCVMCALVFRHADEAMPIARNRETEAYYLFVFFHRSQFCFSSTFINYITCCVFVRRKWSERDEGKQSRHQIAFLCELVGWANRLACQ